MKHCKCRGSRSLFLKIETKIVKTTMKMMMISGKKNGEDKDDGDNQDDASDNDGDDGDYQDDAGDDQDDGDVRSTKVSDMF